MSPPSTSSRRRCRPVNGLQAALIVLMAGCATEVAHHTFLNEAYPPKAANHPIDVYTNGLPARPFERVAILDVHCEAQAWMEPTLEHDAIPALKKAARAAGCDAIIEIRDRRMTNNWTFETKARHFSATGVTYK
ncbi:MAG TPA: hypothetical protein VNO52_10370 [Methylomirabilota bacterium]|nr:hypothetical protein [Methylomirabilota bacterium]